MTFDNIEKSRTKGKPINLFYIRYGQQPNSFVAYTDAEQDIIDGGVTYRSISITRGKLVFTGTMDKSTLEVRASRNTKIADLFLRYPPSEVVNLTIKQGHLSDSDHQFLVGWTGRIISSKRTNTEVILSCEAVGTSMKRVGLRRHYQYSCPHVLYGPMCKASKSDATIGTTIEAFTTNTITLPEGWNEEIPSEGAPIVTDVALFKGGIIEWTNSAGDVEIGAIIRITSGRVVKIAGYVRDVNIGDGVSMIRGCGRTMAACRNHNNIRNFGGCPWIPRNNPLGTSKNQFY